MANTKVKQAARAAMGATAAQNRNQHAMAEVHLACQMIMHATGSVQQGIDQGLAAIQKLTGYAAQYEGVKELATAYVAHRNADPFRNKALKQMELKSGIKQIHRLLKAAGFKLAEAPKAETKEAERKRTARAAGSGKKLRTGTPAADKKPAPVLAVRKEDWDSVLIQTDAKIVELIGTLLPPSKINQYNAAVAVYNMARTGFISSVKTLMAQPEPKARAKRTTSK